MNKIIFESLREEATCPTQISDRISQRLSDASIIASDADILGSIHLCKDRIIEMMLVFQDDAYIAKKFCNIVQLCAGLMIYYGYRIYSEKPMDTAMYASNICDVLLTPPNTTRDDGFEVING